MNVSFKKYKCSWFVAFSLMAIMAILACNLWSLYWGHCVVNDFLRIPPIGWLLIGANLVAGLVLFAVKSRKEKQHDKSLCSSCHVRLREPWAYCPNCGDEQRA